ncbi:DUF6303 family protein [Streptomyces sp. CB01373]|uniref:DUF6303 family protein n=1 Tax=Streptomyces sp. CB01373 TaxID=2020325 RepID=UPI000C279552|nr:DUF6303 family protein [Streptomyces sp. CB01373]PJM93550.1 hypothetical protein CG719_21815 [Streptomyces sp. CB01373]
MRTLTAQMSSDGGRPWRLYVVLLGETEWPTFQWERSAPAPTIAERRTALARLGYEMAPGAEWSWIEDSKVYSDDSTPVVLIAAVDVREQEGDAT